MSKPKGEVLYVRISKQNKKWLERTARKEGLSMSDYVNMVFNKLREDKVEDTHHDNSHQASFL